MQKWLVVHDMSDRENQSGPELTDIAVEQPRYNRILK